MPRKITPIATRFGALVEKTDTCWLWKGHRNMWGYGQFRYEGKIMGAHRVAFILAGQIIPDGYHIDHVWARGCRNKHCVNPAHLEAITPGENNRRKMALITHCRQGHSYSPENTLYDKHGYRLCRACGRVSQHAYMQRKKAANAHAA